MAHTMQSAEGIGLAAPQVGTGVRLFVVHPLAFTSNDSRYSVREGVTSIEELKTLAFFNPVIHTCSKRSDIAEEGCLSLPGIVGFVERSTRIVFEALDINGNRIAISAKGLLARVIQHECDHLEGVLIVDKLVPDPDPTKRVTYKRYNH